MDETAHRIPVIVGIGQINDRPADDAAGHSMRKRIARNGPR